MPDMPSVFESGIFYLNIFQSLKLIFKHNFSFCVSRNEIFRKSDKNSVIKGFEDENLNAAWRSLLFTIIDFTLIGVDILGQFTHSAFIYIRVGAR